MSSFLQRILPRGSHSEDSERVLSPSKKSRLHHRCASEGFNSALRQSSSPDDSPTLPCRPVSQDQFKHRLSCYEGIHYPIYNPEDPRHNPAVKNRLLASMPLPSSEQEPAPRTLKPSKAGSFRKRSPVKSLRRARSNLKALAESIRSKSLFHRKDIPSFSESPQLTTEDIRPMPSASPHKAVSDAPVYHSEPVNIPTRYRVAPCTPYNSPPPGYSSSSEVKRSDDGISFYESNPSAAKDSPPETRLLSRLDLGSSGTTPSDDAHNLQSTIDTIFPSTASATNHEAKLESDEFVDEDVFGPLFADQRSWSILKTPRSLSDSTNTTPKTPKSVRFCEASRTSSEESETTHCAKPASPNTPERIKKMSSFDARTSLASFHTAFRLPSSTYGVVPSASDSCLSSSPGLWMAKEPQVSRTSLRQSQCNTERDSGFGTDLCRPDRHEDKGDSAKENNEHLMQCLVSMNAFEDAQPEKAQPSPKAEDLDLSENSDSLRGVSNWTGRDNKIFGNKHVCKKGGNVSKDTPTRGDSPDRSTSGLHPIGHTNGETKLSECMCAGDNETAKDQRLCSERYVVKPVHQTYGPRNDKWSYSPNNLLPIGLSESPREQRLRSNSDSPLETEFRKKYAKALLRNSRSEDCLQKKGVMESFAPVTALRKGAIDGLSFPGANYDGRSKTYSKNLSFSGTSSRDSNCSNQMSSMTDATTRSSVTSIPWTEIERYLNDPSFMKEVKY